MTQQTADPVLSAFPSTLHIKKITGAFFWVACQNGTRGQAVFLNQGEENKF